MVKRYEERERVMGGVGGGSTQVVEEASAENKINKNKNNRYCASTAPLHVYASADVASDRDLERIWAPLEQCGEKGGD